MIRQAKDKKEHLPSLAGLAERAQRLRAELDSALDLIVEMERDERPGVPAETHRRLLTMGSACRCSTIARLARAKETTGE